MFIFRSPEEIKEGDSGPKISSVCGANRKRKWNEEEDEEDEQAEESSDLDSSSDDEDEVNDALEEGKDEEAASPCQKMEDKQKVMEEQRKSKEDAQSEKTFTEQDKQPSQPAIFIPVDRSPETQVCPYYVCLSMKQQSNSS